MENTEIDSFKELFKYADFNTIFVDTEPEIISPKNFDMSVHKKHSEIKIIEDQEVVSKIIVIPTTYHYQIKISEDVIFKNPETKNTHCLNQYDMVLLNQINGKWNCKIIEDMRKFNDKYEEVLFNDYSMEEVSINKLKEAKCKILKEGKLKEFEDFKKDLQDKSTVKIGSLKFKRNL